MTTTLKTNADNDYTPIVPPALDEQLLAKLAKQGTPVTVLEVDEDGGLVIDEERHPHLYDWVVNG